MRSTKDLDSVDVLAMIRSFVRRGDKRTSLSLQKATGYSASVLSRYFNMRYNFTINAYQKYFRLYYSARRMIDGDRMEHICLDLERNYIWMIRDFKRVYMVTPGVFRALPVAKQRELLLITPISFPEDINE